MTKFALGTYEIHQQNPIELDYIFNDTFEYVDTALDYNNDYCIAKYLNKHNYKLISKVASCHVDDYELFVSSHLKVLGRDKIDIMLIHSDRGNWQAIAKKMANDTRFVEIGVSNFTIDEIKEFKEITGKFPAYNETEVNPFYIDQPTIQFCKDNNIKVIGYELLGGKYFSERFTTIYGLHNLIENAKKYCDILIIKPTSIYQMDVLKATIENKFAKASELPYLDEYKIMQPMVFNADERIDKYYKNYKVYNNIIPNIDLKLVDQFEMPNKYEFLCDYLIKLRYTKGFDEYIGDFLRVGNKYYLLQIIDKEDKLTKVTLGGETIKVLVFEEV